MCFLFRWFAVLYIDFQGGIQERINGRRDVDFKKMCFSAIKWSRDESAVPLK